MLATVLEPNVGEWYASTCPVSVVPMWLGNAYCPTNENRGLSPLSLGERQRTIYSLDCAHSGENIPSASIL